MAPLIEVPPPNSLRGAASIALARLRRWLILDQRPVGDDDVQKRPGPLNHGHRNRPRTQRPDGVEHLRIAERRRVALLLQFEAAHADAARRVDREHERDRNRARARLGFGGVWFCATTGPGAPRRARAQTARLPVVAPNDVQVRPCPRAIAYQLTLSIAESAARRCRSRSRRDRTVAGQASADCRSD